MDFGIPGEAIGKASGRIFDRKKRNEKSCKKFNKVVGSAGDADPARRDFGRIRTRQVQHAPCPSGGDGRADSMCCAQTAARRSSYAQCGCQAN